MCTWLNATGAPTPIAEWALLGFRLAGARARHHFSGGHSSGRDRRDRGPRADALGQRMRTAHRSHVNSGQPGRSSRPARPVPLAGAPEPSCGEQRSAQLTAARPARNDEPADESEDSSRRRRNLTHRWQATSAAAGRNTRNGGRSNSLTSGWNRRVSYPGRIGRPSVEVNITRPAASPDRCGRVSRCAAAR